VRKIFSSVLCVLLIAVHCFGQGQTTATSTGEGDGTPFSVMGGFLIVFQGRIGARSGLRFVLDTGATHSTVNRKLAQEMRVPLHPTQVFDFDRSVPMESGVFPDVEFGPVHVTGVGMLVADFTRLSDFANGVDAIIGSDLLSLSNFSIDYDAQKLFFAPVQTNATSVKPRPHPTVMILELRVQDCPVDLVVDTGVEGVVLFEDRLRSRIPRLRTEGTVGDFTFGRQSRAKQAILPEVRLGARTADLKVLLMKGPHGDVLPGIDGYWGTASIKARRINFNFATNRLSWQE
jgi:predicted aspartyl protease